MLDGKVVVVTGAGGGIGRDVALAFAAAGAKVVVNDVGGSLHGVGQDMSAAASVVHAIQAQGGEAVASGESVAEWQSAQAIVATAMDHFGRIDSVVNVAGILRDHIFHQMEPEEWDAVIRVHLYGTFYMSRAAAPHFRKQQSGSFVHMTSTAGLIGSFGQANYSAAKMGIVGLSRTIAFDMSRFNVRSNCVAPAAFSRMLETIPGATPEQAEKFLDLRRKHMRADQVAPLIVFLASDAASGITGQIIGARGNEVFLFSQPRPIRSLHRSEGWTPESRAEQMAPAWKSSFVPMERTREVFSWDPI